MRIALALGALAVAVVLFLVLRPEGDDDEAATPSASATTAETSPGTTTQPATTTAPAQPEPVRVVFRDGRVRGGIQTFSFEEGDPIRLIVRADVADHVHVHGFDLFTDVAPGHPARFTFRADLTGSFEVELEDRGVPLVELRVRP
ncbi:MAG: hypothetical protein WD805_06095 [Gaiellaceae bacterium]